MHIAHAVKDLDAASGGPSRSVPGLATAIHQEDSATNSTIVFRKQDRPSTEKADISGVIYIPITKSKLDVCQPAKALKSLHETNPIDVIHIHGIWTPSHHWIVCFALRNHIPYIVSPRGMLSQWSMRVKAARKRIAWRLFQRNDLERANAIHATSDSECRDVKRMLPYACVFTIANGCSPNVEQSVREPSGLTPFLGTRIAISIGRIDPVKGLDNLIEAWAKVCPENWSLIIAGPGSPEYRACLVKRIRDLKIAQHVTLIDTVNESEKKFLFSVASLFISASYTENFGIAIAEALSAGLPAITTHGTPWSSVVENECGWWVPSETTALALAIGEATQCDEERLKSMGQRGTQLIESAYSWPSIARQFLSVYRKISEAV